MKIDQVKYNVLKFIDESNKIGYIVAIDQKRCTLFLLYKPGKNYARV